MRKALVKTYIYELIFLCIYLIVMNKLLEIFEEKFILGVFIILIINIVVFFYLIIYLIISLRSQYHVYKLNLSKSIVMDKKLYKMTKINIKKDIHRINLSAYYRLLNKEEEALRYLNEVRISRFTFPIVRYCYYMNLAEYKYYDGKKEEARKILDENIKKESNKNLLEIFLDYEDNPKQKVFELEKILRTNKNKSDKMVEDIADLIKKQQKYAKIGAETNSKYSSLIDGFKIKQEAEKLKKILTDMYSEFKEYYFNKLNKKIPNLEYERKLPKILEIAEKVEVFLNYIYNPKNAKQRTDLNRFDELILIEENEIKRKITKEVDAIIANANLIIIDEEIDTIETKKVLEKLFDIIIGKRKKDKERVIKLEELAEEVDAKLRQTYTINRNYKIHDVLAKIMIFKSENIGDELVKDLVDKITVIEKAIAKNFVISEETVLKKIEELKMLKLPVVVEKDSENEMEYELALIRHKYEYDNIYDEEEVKYVDTTANEIKQIIEYIKLSF